MSLWPKIEKILPRVERPSRYINQEWGAVHKDFDQARVKVALAYPDIYEVGMSHLGLQILYEILNQQEGVVAERLFAPWEDLEALLREENIPLFSLESHRPVANFDMIGFSLQTEMTYTNILNMLELGQIPLYARERREGDPVVVAGGPGAFNPEPLADFFDFFVIGEGEEVILELVRVLERNRSEQALGRTKLLEQMALVSGVYVPSFYDVAYDSDGKVSKVTPNRPEAPPVVLKRAVKDLDAASYPKTSIVPFMNIIHQRATLEVMRGCTRGCRFCQAGIIYRPARERDVDGLLAQADELLSQTGHEELSLASLSTSDYSAILPLLERLVEKFSKNGVSLALPSLRMDAFSLKLANRLGAVKKTGLTFAPEAGSQRLRRAINKDISEDDLMNATKSAFEAGWEKLKLYFMFGLPFEKGDDLEAIVSLARRLVKLCRETVAPRKRGRAKITFNVSPFVPKAHTPFQWSAQNSFERLAEKQNFLRVNLKGKHLNFRTHDIGQAIIEGALARGDRRLSGTIERAWRLGATFDAWKEKFDFSRWKQAFDETGLSLEFYTMRKRSQHEVLPWDHIHSGVPKQFLWDEYEKAKESEVTADCRAGPCTDCAVCLELDIPIDSYAS